MPLARRISHTVGAATLTPSPAISPWILRYPHPGFSRASRRTRAWMFRRVTGRPVLPRMDLAAQQRPAMSRCQRRIVSGVTGSRSPWRRALGITLSRVAMSARSAQFSFGRCGGRRRRTASWWRRIKISAVFRASSFRDSRRHSAIRVIRRKTNRRHMIGDHYDRTPGGATLLVRAMDGIFGTHTSWRPFPDHIRASPLTLKQRAVRSAWASARCRSRRWPFRSGHVRPPAGQTGIAGSRLGLTAVGQVSRGSPGGAWIGTGGAACTWPWTRSGGSAPG
jgi:hypothetical protein